MVDWHQRYLQQSYWTKSLRDYLISTLQITPGMQAQEIGCGTGVIASDFQQSTQCNVIGIDVNYSTLLSATRNYPKLQYLNADALSLPFDSNCLDLVFCHYFLLWIDSPAAALLETMRVLKPGGHLLIFAEPDHSSRIDEPGSLVELGRLQTEALQQQGACVDMGRRLPALLSLNGFDEIRYGIIGNEHILSGLPSWWDSEWQILRDDLKNTCTRKKLDRWKTIDRKAWEQNSRVLWVPTFYAVARKPDI